MRTLSFVLVLSFGALTFQTCSVYPNTTSGGYYGHGYYNGDYSDRLFSTAVSGDRIAGTYSSQRSPRTILGLAITCITLATLAKDHVKVNF